MSDYFERLEAHLMSAVPVAARSHTSASETVGHRWLAWRRPRSLVAVLIGLVVCGSGVAAALKLTDSSSHALSGRVPVSQGAPSAPESGARTLAGDSYRIGVSPDLDAGDVGWCTSIAYSSHGRLYTGWGSCETGGGYPTPGSPLFGSSAGLGPPGRLSRGERVVYVLAGPRVAAVRIGASTVLPVAQPGLPVGDRAAVFFLPISSPPAAIPPSGVPYPYRFTMQEWGAGHPRRVQAIPMLALDAQGQVIRYDRRAHSRRRLVHFWQRGASRELRAHGIATHPSRGACELQAHSMPAIVGVLGRTMTRIVAAPDAEGQAFMSCASTLYTFHGRPLQAAVLLDAQRPGETLTNIPGARPLAGHPGYVNAPLEGLTGALTARRDGNAWIVVQGHFGLTYRLGLLESLTLGALKLAP
jgi:hypothetical protein